VQGLPGSLVGAAGGALGVVALVDHCEPRRGDDLDRVTVAVDDGIAGEGVLETLHRDRGPFRRRADEAQNERIAAVATDDVLAAHHITGNLGQVAQHAIAEVVTGALVDRRHAHHVDHPEGDR
jgi:hypothetical protein